MWLALFSIMAAGLATVTGGGLILYVIRKPKVELISIDFVAWWFLYNGDSVSGINIEIDSTLGNTGETGSYISNSLELDLRQNLGK